MNKIISLDTYVQRNDDIIDATIDGETVMLDISSGTYHGLDIVAGEIWRLLETSTEVSSICKDLVERFDVGDVQCQKEVMQFLNELAEKNVIEIS